MREKTLVVGIALLLLAIILLDCLARYSENMPLLVTAQNDYNFSVPPLTTRPVVIQLNRGDRLKGQFTIAGGERNDIAFQIEDPLGNKFVDIYRIYDMFCYMDFAAGMDGDHRLYFDNTFSENSEKNITLATKVISSQRLFLANILVILLATIGAGLSVAGAKTKPKSETFAEQNLTRKRQSELRARNEVLKLFHLARAHFAPREKKSRAKRGNVRPRANFNKTSDQHI